MTTTTPAVPAVITPKSGTPAASGTTSRGPEPQAGVVPFEQALEEARAQLEGNQPEVAPGQDMADPALDATSVTAPAVTDVTDAAMPVSQPVTEAAMPQTGAASEADMPPQAASLAQGLPMAGQPSGDLSGETTTVDAAPSASAQAEPAQRLSAASGSHVTLGSPAQPIRPVPAEGAPSSPPKDGLRTSAIPQPASPQSPSTTAEPVAPAAAPPAQAATTTSTPVVATPVPETRPAVQHPLLHEQITPRLVGIRSLGDGTHRMTLRVEPEAIGPLRIVAEIRGEHMRVEFMAVGELGREALRSAIPELRRDLAAAGMQAQLDLASGGRGSDGDAGRPSGDQLGNGGRQTDVRDGVHAQEAQPASRWVPAVPPGRIDVLA